MIKVVIPGNNRNNFSIITDDVLRDITLRLFDVENFVKVQEERAVGRYFKIVNDETNEIHYVVFCNPDNDSRNAHLLQFVPPVYRDFFVDQSPNKHLDVYIVRPDSNDRTPYIKLFYRCFKNLGINIINQDNIGISDISPYQSYVDLKNDRDQIRSRNSHNESTYFDNNDNDITIYGKTDGTNVNESFMFAITLAKIMDAQPPELRKPIIFYPVKDKIKDEYKEILADFNIEVKNYIETLPDGKAKAEASDDIDGIRNTKIYHFNLLQKYGDKKCYVCGCDIEHMIIGSHIERVTDIKNNPHYSQAEKLSRAVDGDNGFWLCANHDKMFEYGIIYFDQRLLRIGQFILDPKQIEFINWSIYDTRRIYDGESADNAFMISESDFNANMQQYVEIHARRVA